MKLYEYMGKELFKKYNIPIPTGQVFYSVSGVEEWTVQLGTVVIKSQVLSGGRGKDDGIKFASNPEDARKWAQQLLAKEVKGEPVQSVLVEEKLAIDQEYYLAVTVDGMEKKPIIIASAAGGMDIESVPDEQLIKVPVDVSIGVQPYLGREIARQLGLAPKLYKKFAELLVNLYRLFREYDCELVEINPLANCGEQLIAADAKVTVDDDAAFRYPTDLPRVDERSLREKQAAEIGISYVELDGNIAVMANGAGITMATLDILKHYGGRPRNFMDAGGGAGMEATAKALEILLSTNPRAILVNIFGGITRCNDVANAFKQVQQLYGIPVPLVIRLVGTNEQQGVEILKSQGIDSFRTIHEAVAKVIEVAATIEEGN